MKPLLRAVLILDALLLLAFGLLFLLTPWTSLYNALLLVQTQPALVGQGFGVALIGLAWLALHASIDGALTASVAKVVGHVNWLTGVLMLVWLLGLHTPALNGFGQIAAVLTGVVLLVVGLGGVRLSGAVRRRERVRFAEAAAAERTQQAERKAARQAEKQAAKDAAKDAARGGTRDAVKDTADRREPGRVTAGFPVYHAEPAVAPAVVEPVVPVTSATRPLQPAVDEAGLTASERAAREETRNAAADASGTPRPPLHG